MALRVFPNYSPRLILVSAPGTEETMQELHNDVCRWQQEPANLSYPKLIDTSGKQELRGGVLVGLTARLYDALVGFEQRHIILESGTVTTPQTVVRGLIKLIDSAADFEAAGVEPGDWVINFTDQSWCTVLTVRSANELVCFNLGGGTDNAFDAGDTYKVLDMVQCEASGGNLTALDSNGDPVSPVLPTACVNFVLTSSSSATLQEQAAIQHAAFGGMVTVDSTTSYTGIGYPNGTGLQPINNMPDALAIAVERGFRTFFIKKNMTLTDQDYSSKFIFIGEAPHLSTITLQAGANVTGCEFRNVTIEGTLDGDNTLAECAVNDLVYFNGLIKSCALGGIISLSGSADALIIDSYCGGSTVPIIDCGGSGQGLTVRNYNGDLEVRNKISAGDAVSIDLNSGKITLQNTVTAGEVVIRGVGVLENNSAGATVVDQLLTGGDVKRILGLLHENSFVDNTTYDGAHQMLTARVRCFDTKAHAEAATDGGSEDTGLIATYTVSAEYTGLEMDQYRMVKEDD